MAYDYRKLLGRIVERVGTQKRFAELIGLSEHSVSQKLNNALGWKQEEIRKICEILEIPPVEVHSYFFTEQVQY